MRPEVDADIPMISVTLFSYQDMILTSESLTMGMVRPATDLDLTDELPLGLPLLPSSLFPSSAST